MLLYIAQTTCVDVESGIETACCVSILDSEFIIVPAASGLLHVQRGNVGMHCAGVERAVAWQHTMGFHRGFGHTFRAINQAPLLPRLQAGGIFEGLGVASGAARQGLQVHYGQL